MLNSAGVWNHTSTEIASVSQQTIYTILQWMPVLTSVATLCYPGSIYGRCLDRLSQAALILLKMPLVLVEYCRRPQHNISDATADVLLCLGGCSSGWRWAGSVLVF